MKVLKIDFTKDYYTNEKIDIEFYRNKLKNEGVKNGLYLSVISKKYHEEKYNKEFREILIEFFEKDIPKCPVTNLPVQFYLSGKIIFAQFSPFCTNSKRQKWMKENNQKVIEFHNRMKIERIGEGNPCFGKIYSDEERKKISIISKSNTAKRNETRRKWSDEKREIIKNKMKESAIKSALNCPNRGMKGKTHSIESIEKMRTATIKRLKEGKFPQTDTSINKIFESLLNDLNLQYEKEFRYGHFCFDFKIKNYLIEIQGDYWHWNPIVKFKRERPPFAVSQNIKRDKAKRLEVLKFNEYKLLEFWETDINKNLKDIELCLKKLFHVNL